MLAVICLFAPAAIWLLVRGILFPSGRSDFRWMGEYLLCCLLLNCGIFAFLPVFSGSGARPIYNLNHSPLFAVKYFALALALLLIEIGAEKLFGKKLSEKFAPFIEKLPAPVKKYKTSRVVNAVVFSIGLVVMFVYLNFIMQPMWGSGNYNPVLGIYEEPSNTIQVLCLGASNMREGVSPMDLYECYGVPAYDLTTDGQALAASYFWLKEIYDRHSDSLETVVFDVSVLRHNSGIASYRKATDLMHFSINKFRAVQSYSGDFSELLINMSPLLSYHERWKELDRGDIGKFVTQPKIYMRGYYHHISQWITDENDFSKIVTPLLITDPEAEMTLNEKSVKYFRKMVDFCQEHNLRLLLIKTPTYWTSETHNAVQMIANEYGLDFLDFNVEPYYSEINFNIAANVITPADIKGLHLNYFGATKLTDYLGKYLTEKYGARDVRGDPKYAFMDEQLADYHRHIIDATLANCIDPCDYIKYALELGQYTIFISVKDDAAHALTDEQRKNFASLGLTKLSSLSENASYLAVVDDGKIVKEISEEDPGENATGHPISFTGKTSDGMWWYSVTSGGKNLGNTSSVRIRWKEYSLNERGLNVVLYDNKLRKFAASASAVFDTHAAPLRPIQNVEQRLKAALEAGATLPELSGTDRALFLYNRKCDLELKNALAREAKRANDLPKYLAEFLDDDRLEIYLAAKNDATLALTDESREKLRDILPKLAELKNNETYIAILRSGNVVLEKSAESLLTERNDKYLLRSGTNRDTTIMIDGEKYIEDENGIHVAIYDPITGKVVETATFGAQNWTPNP